MTEEEFDALYPRSCFIDDETYELAKESFLKHARPHRGCPYFIDVWFDGDTVAVRCDGICTKHHKAIPHFTHGGCEENPRNRKEK